MDRAPSARSMFRAARQLSVVALCILAQVSGVAHMLLVEHATCPEHGELIDTGRLALHAAMHAERAHDEPSAEAKVVLGGASGSDCDDHCTVLGIRRDQAVPQVFCAPVVPGAALASAQLAPRSQPHQPSVALYLLAPKCSPPV